MIKVAQGVVVQRVESDGRVVDLMAADGVEILPAPAHEDGPSLVDLARNFAGATARWVTAGLPVVTQEVYAGRAVICGGCEYWQADARLGLGECTAPGCGCTSLKLWLATERCPEGKWAAEG